MIMMDLGKQSWDPDGEEELREICSCEEELFFLSLTKVSSLHKE
jgi:hypothetical protein